MRRRAAHRPRAAVVIFCEDGREIAAPVTFEPQRRDDLFLMTLVGVDRPPFHLNRVSSTHRGR